MKKPAVFQVLLFCLIVAVSGAQEASSDLIPRSLFFKGITLSDFQLNESGDLLYHRSDEFSDRIYRQSIASLDDKKEQRYEGDVTDFVPFGEDLLVIWKDERSWHLTKGEQSISLPEGVTALKFLSDINEKGSIALELRSADVKNTGLFKLTVSEGRLEKLGEIPEGFSRYYLDGEFNILAGSKGNEQGGNALYFFKEGEWKLLNESGWYVDMFLGGFTRILGVAEDGNTIYYTSNADTDKARLFAFDVANEQATLLASNDRVDILPFSASYDTKGKITSAVGLYAKTIREVVDPACAEDFAYLEERLEGDLSFIQSVAEDKKWLIRELKGGPAKIYLFDRPAKTLTYLRTTYPALDAYALASRHAYSVPTKDELSLPVHVYLPPGSDEDQDGIPDEPLPTVLYVHGGPWVGVVHWNQYFHWRNFQLLANRGYAVINCEFRGGSGLGKEFVEKSIQTWGTDMTEDKKTIAEWAISKGIARNGKVGIWGWSYGGYAAMAGLAFAPETYACGVSMYGISDLEAFGRIPFTDNEFWRNWVGDPNDEKEKKMLEQYSPINFLEDIKAPLLMTTGSLDRRIPQEQMGDMAEAMKEAGKEVVYFYYPEEGHDYRDPDSWISFWSVTEHFLKEHLGGRAAPIEGDFELGNKIVVEGKEEIEEMKG